MGPTANLADSVARNHPVRPSSGGNSHQGPPGSGPGNPGVERTRATFLSYGQHDQAAFTADLRTLLEPATHIDLAQETLLAMAPAATRG